MSLLDVATIIVATYGALLSSYLGYRELSKNKRKIKIILEHVYWEERFQITVVNIGYRPITIAGIAIAIPYENYDGYMPLPSEFILGNDPFPETLLDGASMVIRLSNEILDVYSYALSNKEYKPKITVFDAEGNKYTKYGRQDLDVKWQAINKEKKMENNR